MSTQITTAPATIQAAPATIQAAPAGPATSAVPAPRVVRQYRIQPVGGTRLAGLLAPLRGARATERRWHWQPVATQPFATPEGRRVQELRGQAVMLMVTR
jgi:hypothetical protein